MCLTKDSRHPVQFWSQPNHNFPRRQALYVKLKLVAMPFFDNDEHFPSCFILYLIITTGGDVLLDGVHFHQIPRAGITISTWVKLDTNKGIQSIFDTVGSHSRHKDGQYHFEIENGKVRWFHRNENHDTIFSLLSRPVVREGVWTQITATYSAKKQRARVSIVIKLKNDKKLAH